MVKPEGLTKYINDVVFIDLKNSDTFSKSLQLLIPSNIVPDSARIEVSVYGYLLSPTIKNLHNLIKKPYGCGEQNLLNFVPNIIVLDYLTSIDQMTRKIKTNAIQNMEFGYQNQLKFKHNDGSFSAWGEGSYNANNQGSTWLTAYVAKTFRQASKYVNIDENIIKSALQFLANAQLQSGKFSETSEVLYIKHVQRSSAQGIGLTAYILIAFLVNKRRHPEFYDNIKRASDYISNNIENIEDIYTLALVAYALNLADHEKKDRVLTKLESRAIVDTTEAMKYWTITNTKKTNPTSIDIETTAYALLAYIEADWGNLTPILNWLLKQRNEQGGFKSTQDTVVALQAIAKFGPNILHEDTNINLDIFYSNEREKNFEVNIDNLMLMQSVILPRNTRNIDITATGTGFAVAQISYQYNVNQVATQNKFRLSVRYIEADRSVAVCTSYVPSNNNRVTNMAIMEVNLLSGITADLENLQEVKHQSNKVQHIETKNSQTKVIIYFDYLDQNQICLDIPVTKTHEVQMKKPATVSVYDYYDDSKF